MKFDDLTIKPCLNAPSQTECEQKVSGGGDTPPVVIGQSIIIKPGYASVAVGGTVKFKTYLLENGIESEITSGLLYSIANSTIGLVGATSGSSVGIAEGVSTVTVRWNGLEDSAQLNVVGDCSEQVVAMAVVCDVSSSMSQPLDGYGTKIGFAKTLAKRFVTELNVLKDNAAVFYFATNAGVGTGQTAIKTQLESAVNALTVVNSMSGGTNLLSGLNLAQSVLGAATASIKVILLITDGEVNELANWEQYKNYVDSLHNAGYIIMVAGTRAYGDGFTLLEYTATGGFFVNAYDKATGQQAIDWISGAKGYFCAGNCDKVIEQTENVGELNYVDFTDWDVVTNHVDLIGNGLFDFLPGNGLYVDLCGSTIPVDSGTGELKLEGVDKPSYIPAWFADWPAGGVWPEWFKASKWICDGIKLKTNPWDAQHSAPTSFVAPAQTIRVFGGTDEDDCTNLIKEIVIDCADQVEMMRRIGPNADVVLRFGNTTAYNFYRVQFVDACDAGASGVRWISCEFYSVTAAVTGDLGLLRTKTTWNLSAMNTYRLTVTLAGNQREGCTNDVVGIRVGQPGNYVLDDQVTLPAGQPFTEYEYTFVGDGAAQIEIEQVSSCHPSYGCLLKSVLLENVTVPATVFSGDFQDENPQTVTDPCPPGYEGIYTGCGGYGCLEYPPSEQAQDPAPLARIEPVKAGQSVVGQDSGSSSGAPQVVVVNQISNMAMPDNVKLVNGRWYIRDDSTGQWLEFSAYQGQLGLG